MAKHIEVTKTFNAPVETLWRVWVEPELVKRWWGPKHFTSPVARMDFREGGRSVVSMMAPAEMGGFQHYSLWEYVKIAPYTTIEFIQSICNEDGNKIPPTSVGLPADFPLDVRTVVSFSKLTDKTTEMTVTEYADFGSISNFAQIGLEQTVEKIAAIFE